MERATSTNRKLMIGGAIIAGLAVVAIGARAFVADAFGGPLDAAHAIPQDVAFVAVLDLAEARDGLDSEFIDLAFRAAQEAGELPAGDPMDGYQELIEEETGIDIVEDVIPWVGRSVAAAMDGELEDEDVSLMLLSAVVRDEGKAWAFIDKLADRADEEPGTSISSMTVDGTRVVVIESDEEPLHLTIRDEYMLVGNSTDTLNAAFATIESGDSVFDADWFSAANSELNDDAWLKVMIDPSFIKEAYEEANAQLDEAGLAPSTPEQVDLLSIGMSYAMDGNRIVLEGFAETVEPIEDLPRIEAMPVSAAERLGGDPMMVMGSQLPADMGAMFLDQIEEAEPGSVESMVDLSRQFVGVDLVNALIAEMGDHFLFGMEFDDRGGVAVEGFLGLADSQPMIDAIEEMKAQMLADGAQVGGARGEIDFGPDAPRVAVTDGELTGTFYSGIIGGGTFANSEGYEWLEATFPDGFVFYLDLHEMLLVSENMEGDPLFEQIDWLRMGATFDSSDTVFRGTLIMEMELTDR